MQLELDSGIVPGTVDAAAIEQALGRVGWNSDVTFAVLTAGAGDPAFLEWENVDAEMGLAHQ